MLLLLPAAGETATARTQDKCVDMCATCCPFLTSKTLVCLSSLPVKSSWESVLKATLRTGRVCPPSCWSVLPVAVSKMCTAPLASPLARQAPSGEYATHIENCPSLLSMSILPSPVVVSYTFTPPDFLPDAKRAREGWCAISHVPAGPLSIWWIFCLLSTSNTRQYPSRLLVTTCLPSPLKSTPTTASSNDFSNECRGLVRSLPSHNRTISSHPPVAMVLFVLDQATAQIASS
mmetsp:Transcript_7142/g.13517  ORF Transcript_7142/g.13517 Transcript_7142/m.13517 type:complete len:233 (-) Transcript_7142:58-756(-)